MAKLADEKYKLNDVKSVASSWKLFLKLSKQVKSIHQNIQQHLNPMEADNEDDLFDWLTNCVQIICESITTSIQEVS